MRSKYQEQHTLINCEPCIQQEFNNSHTQAMQQASIIIITRVSGQVHCAYSCKSTLVQDKQDTTRRPVI
jgi:hypothetical protein